MSMRSRPRKGAPPLPVFRVRVSVCVCRLAGQRLGLAVGLGLGLSQGLRVQPDRCKEWSDSPFRLILLVSQLRTVTISRGYLQSLHNRYYRVLRFLSLSLGVMSISSGGFWASRLAIS